MLHFAYTSKNMAENATGKNWMTKTLSLRNFLSDARQLWVYIIAKRRKPIMTHLQYKSIWRKKLSVNMPQFIERTHFN